MGERDHAPLPLNLEDLASTIALASEALAAASQALAEAARAISDASGALKVGNIAIGDPTDSTLAGTKPYYTDEIEARSEMSKSLHLKDLDVIDNQQTESRPPSPSIISISSDTSDEEDANPVDSSSFSLQDKAGANRPLGAFEPELNNKRDVSPLQPPRSPDMREPIFTDADADVPRSSHQSNMSLLAGVIASSTIPPGRNYMPLDLPSDALAFIAYMAMQFHTIVCVVSGNLQGAYGELLEDLSHANVYCIDTPNQYDDISTTSEYLSPEAYHILLVPWNNLILNLPWIQKSRLDCIIHWTQPASIYHNTTGWALNYLPHTVRACLMVIGGESFDGSAQGVEPYPTSIMNRCFYLNSTFQELKQMAFQLLPTRPAIPSVPPAPKAPFYSQAPQPYSFRSLNPFDNLSESVIPLPAGHYYILLDQSNDIDVIPIITYIARNSVKSICHIPLGKSLSQYQRLVSRISGINVIIPGPERKGAKKVTKRLKSANRGLLLKNVASDWYSRFSKSLADSLVYCGIPADLTVYLRECTMKVDTSYLILTRSQYSAMQWSSAAYQSIKQHPYLYINNFSSQDSPIYRLRLKLAPHL